MFNDGPHGPKESDMAVSLPDTGFLRLRDIVGDTKAGIPAIIPVSKSTWWQGCRTGRYPKPTRALGARITCWRCEDIRALIEATAPESAP